MTKYPNADHVDIALILEGSYPFVTGGVSNWVHQIINAFPQYKFAGIFLGSRPEDYKGLEYDIPGNLVHLDVNYLFDNDNQPTIQPMAGNNQVMEEVENFHNWLKFPNNFDFNEKWCSQAFYSDDNNDGIDFSQFLYSRASWQYICKSYEKYCTDPSFIDYFWSIRNMHRPIWQIAKIAKRLPIMKMVHCVSTGYAGFLGSLLHHQRNIPLCLSEHGLYAKERRIDLMQTVWHTHHRYSLQINKLGFGYFHQLWTKFFEALARMCYDCANPIVSLFSMAQQWQVEYGADASRTTVIANGVDIDNLRQLRQVHTEIPKVICLIGRVVPMKDVKTFIRSASILRKQIPDLQAWIVGPDDEDVEYASECRGLVTSLNLADCVQFFGEKRLGEILPKVGLTILTSISEGLPLIVLESFAAGLPMVATDVGSCKQLIYGLPGEDEQLGKAGEVVSIANPQAVADACYHFLLNKQAWLLARDAAITRVEKYYHQQDMFDKYDQIYSRMI